MRELIELQAPPLYEVCRRIIRERKIDVVFRHFIAFGAGWAAEEEDVGHAVGVLTPMFWFSKIDPSTLTPYIENMPLWMVRLLVEIQKFTGRWVFDRPTNRARKVLGLSPIKNSLRREFLGGDLNLGLWSPDFRKPLADDPKHGKVCGFTWFDRQDAATALSPELERFVGAGEPPIVFTLGTSVVHHAGNFYEIAAEAAQLVGRRAVLLTGNDGTPPRGLPAGVEVFPYAPFSALLPRAACTVHHGGIGTTAQAMRSGKPTVIIPYANDEFDNAARARKLGVSATLHLRRLNVKNMAETLRRVLDDPAVSRQAAALGTPLEREDGAVVAAEAIEGRFGGTPREPGNGLVRPTDAGRLVRAT